MLTPHFALAEFTVTSTGLLNHPPPEVQCNLRVLCAAVLEPFRVQTGPLRVTSGYRSKAVNDKLREQGVGASPKSLHLTGEAADVVPRWVAREVAWDMLVERVRAGTLLVDEAIVYEASPHLHLAFTTTRVPRGRLRVKPRVPWGGRRYVPWAEYVAAGHTLPPLE